MTYSLGYVPAEVQVHLTTGGDFIQSLTTSDGSNWPAGVTITLVIGTASWPATITGPTAAWNVDKTVVGALSGPGTGLKVKLVYSDSAGIDLTWMTGRVVWHG